MVAGWNAYDNNSNAADVTGHGTPAALVASFAKGATDMIYADWSKRGAGHPPLRLVHENLNDMLRSGVGELAFMTMFSVTIDLRKHEIFYLNSGHRPGPAQFVPPRPAA